MAKGKRGAIVVVALMAMVPIVMNACVFSGTATMHLSNRTGKTIYSVFMRPQGSAYWEKDMLESGQTIKDGEAKVFYSIEPGNFEIRVDFTEDGSDQDTLTQTFKAGNYTFVTFR